MKETLEVKVQGEKLVWKVSADIKPNTEVLVHEGAQAVVIYDGAPLDNVAPGQRKTINTKGFFEKKNRGVYEVYGVNTGKLIELNWGTRNPPEYKDLDYNVVLKVKSYGRCSVRVENPFTLFKLTGTSGEALTEDGLRSYIAEKMSAVGTETVSAVAHELGRKAEIQAASARIAKMMSDKFRRSFYDEYGLRVEDSVVLSINIDTSVWDEKNSEIVAAQMDTKLSDEGKKQAMNGVEVLKGLNEATAKPAEKKEPADEKPRFEKKEWKDKKDWQEKKDWQNKKQSEKQDYKFCTECGKRLPADAKFCSDCGKRL